MFRKLFGRKKKKNRDLFKELFPLTEEYKKQLENEIISLQKVILGDTETKEKRIEQDKVVEFQSLKFNSLGWTKQESEGAETLYSNQFGDFIMLNKIPVPGGQLKRDQPSELEVYRNWMRQRFAQMGGSIISCEEYKDDNGLEALESIIKMSRGQDEKGMDYIYFLNIRNYEEQALYQINVKVHEAGMTGLRDNLLVSPLSRLTKMNMEELFENDRQDPYDKELTVGISRNLSEMADFDYLFPSHPLSIIRTEIRPKMLESLRF